MSRKVGIIGFGSQAKRIFKILKAFKIKISYIYKKKIDKKSFNNLTDNFNKIKECNAIFICSPNSTHFKYIEKLYKGRYIFCEKPPVDSFRDLNSLKKINISKTYFNFNYRFSRINEAINKTKKYRFGKLIYGNIIFGHGLATKKKYKNTWRSNNNAQGVYEVVGIHLIDLIINNFKILKVKKELVNLLKSNSPDNAYFSIKLREFGQIDCLTSYSSPYIQKFIFIYENGILEISDNLIIFKGPRNTFDKKGFFVTPKTLLKEKFNNVKDYEDSLKKSIKYFMKISKSGKKFDLSKNKLSLTSNEILLKK